MNPRVAMICVLCLGSHLLAALPCAAQPSPAKAYFDAGAAAYAVGDYLAAAQALEAAFRIEPLPAIAFSLAQAERRQYFVSQDLVHLGRALELYRRYLDEVPTGGRRADVTDALAQLEPIALARGLAQDGTEQADAGRVAATRVMVRSAEPGARIAVDGAAPVASPLIVETTPGVHQVRVEAPGFWPVEREVTAIAGELIPLDVSLRERSALLKIQHSDELDVYVDGRRVAPAVAGTLPLSAGTHVLAFARHGHRVQRMQLTLERGAERKVSPQLRWTAQRVAAITLFAVGAASAVTGLVLTGLALDHQGDARDVETERQMAAITRAQQHAYEEAIQSRNRYRALAVGSLAIAAGTLLTGLLLYQFDGVDPKEVAPGPNAGVAFVPTQQGFAVHAQLLGRIQ